MATALQQQLAAIAEKSTNQLDLKAQRSQHSQSLLFEPREAAGQTFDTLYQIALDGFEDLCMLDARFVEFARNLFSEQSKSEDRTQMTAAENEELDGVIQSFLGLISGRLLLSPGQKALEWLVRRFRIHEYNTEYFVLAFLPYHDNSIFPTMLSILPKSRDLSPAIKFLQPAINNPSFFTLLNRFVLSTTKQKNQSATLLGFWASILAQTVNGQLDSAQSGRSDVKRQREEEVLLRVIPVLQEASQVQDAPELFLGCCMITVILATKIDLQDGVLDALMDTIAGSWTKQTFNDGLACLSVIAQEKSSHALPKVTAKRLLSTPDLFSKLEVASRKYSVDGLATGLALAYCVGRKSKVWQGRSLLVEYFKLDTVGRKSRLAVLSALVARIIANDSDEVERVKELGRDFADVTHLTHVRPLIAETLRERSTSAPELEAVIGAPLQIDIASDELRETDSDADMQDVERVEDVKERTADLEGLVLELKQTHSYLAEDSHESYMQHARTFSKAILSRPDLSIFSRIAGEDPKSILSLLTFTMRVWSSHTVASVRRAALRLAKNVIGEAASSTGDLQALLPYCFVALQDEHEAVRRAAAELVVDVNAIYKRAEHKKSAQLQVLGKDSIYGEPTAHIKWMKSSDAHTALSEAFLESLEECAVDAGNIARTLVTVIEGEYDDIDLKTTIRTHLFSLLLSHAVCTPALRAKASLLRALAPIGKGGTSGRKQILLPAARAWLSRRDAERTEICRLDGIDLAELDGAYVMSLSGQTDEELELLHSVMLGTFDCSATVSFLVAKRLRSIWPTLKDRDQTHLAKAFLDASLETPVEGRTDVSADALELLRQVRLSGDALVALLQSVHALAAMPDSQPATKRRRTSSSRTRSQDVNSEDMTKMIRRLTIVLELIETSKPERHPELLKHLFHALGDLQQVKSQLGSDLVYIQQMLLGSLLAMVESLKGTPVSRIDRSVLRTDLVVDCMRSTSNTQVHSSALLLIAALAGWAPDLVLHSVMPLFTFMSTSILRQGDDYSAHVIDQTVSHVIPPLVSSLRKKNQDLVTGAAELLLSFIAAFEHMPMHRRLQLFKQLITALGPEEALSAVVAMLSEKYPSDLRVPSFCAELSSHFAPTIQMRAIIQYIDLVADALQPRRTVSEAIFTFEHTDATYVQNKAVLMILSLSTFLKEGKLQSQVRAALTRADGADAIEQTAAAMIDRSVGFAKVAPNGSRLRLTSNTVVTAALNLLPTAHFAKAAVPLLDTPDEALGVRILETLEARTSEARSSDGRARAVLLETMPVICAVVESTTSEVMNHAAIACMNKVAEKFGKKEPATVLAAARVLSSSRALGSPLPAIRMMASFALATMVDVLRDEMVPILPAVINMTLGHLEVAVTEQPAVKLCDASLALLTAALECVPWIISQDMLIRIYTASVRAASDSELAIPTRDSRETFISLAAKTLELKITLGAAAACIDAAYAEGVDGTEELLNIVDHSVTVATKSAMGKQHSSILSIIHQTFDLRARVAASADEDVVEPTELDELDIQRNSILMKVIMKLNDATFRPFFVSLVDWATSDSDAALQSTRQHSLYTFLTTFFDTLKSLVTSYATYLLEHTALTLSTLTAHDSDATILLSRITSALRANFIHDQDDFWAAPSHFNAILPGLATQLRAARTISKEDSIDIIPTIVELASAASSPDHLKELNGELLKMMRAREAHVRLAAVKTERALTERLGEDWLSLLPEMLPFIGEVQEDEDEGVEREVLGWIKGIEGVLGESLEGMLQ
ncbi:hypothetical protein CAC42_8204 [Sphaceloma murrayae]|uniref:U3 small nucleolar RNA-associated protein 10 n=1 Tax=Sphaceloma murrayae TaxID=2082308 RepID=A0A2K1QK23_9PEZI|nr:hypothetical protein CAC42_8204 [Sphaceloma murrayae]